MRNFIKIVESSSSIIKEYRTWQDAQEWGSRVSVYLTEDSLEENSLHIDSIAVPNYLKKKGIGGKILTKLMLLCEQHKKSLTLEVDETSDDASWLHSWYTRYGFIEHDEGYGSYGPFMVWYPKTYDLKNLKEGREAPLYHAMDSEKTISVLTNNRMPANWEHTIPGYGTVKGNSFSRNKNNLFNSFRTVILVCDQRKLSQNNKIIPLDGDFVFTSKHRDRLEYDRKFRAFTNELLSEEFVIGDINYLNRYITQIILHYDIPVLKKIIKEYSSKWNIPVKIRGE